ncbi:hypothetical protein [Agromyces sp. NPDC058104]|uniref:hypothetical protein n=1 Tax=Agromyces sp. NPDC058104 TaxID=3346342 RepID=UPI0036DB5D1E
MEHPGADPIDGASDVGKLRYEIGDTEHVPLDPVVAGQVSYGYFSDADLASMLAVADGSILRAAGHAYRRLAAEQAFEGQTVRDLHLSVDTTRRGTQLLAIAESFVKEAEALEEQARLTEDAFVIVPTGSRSAFRESVFDPENWV